MAVKLKAKWIQSVYNFSYTGGEQTFTAPATGYYKLEVWGAQGGTIDSIYRGGYGGYSVGVKNSTKNDKIYVNVGGMPQKNIEPQYTCTDAEKLKTMGYNGGGAVGCTSGASFGDGGTSTGGGGATHIAIHSGLLSDLSSFKDSVLIVAGGGGGVTNYFKESSAVAFHGLGDAGGINGKTTTATVTDNGCLYSNNGGTQSFGGQNTNNGSCNSSTSIRVFK